jgi:hypothetical protein
MNWSDIGHKVADIAPVIGGVLAGPAGSAAGSILASALGTKDNADAVDQAIQTDPDAAAKIKQAELDQAVEMRKLLLTAQAATLQEQTKQQQSVNETMRAELAATGVFKSGWRAAVGWIMALSFGAMTIALCWAVITDPTQLTDAISGLMTMVIAMAGVLGVNIHKTSQERQIAMTGQSQALAMPTGLLGTLVKQTAK